MAQSTIDTLIQVAGIVIALICGFVTFLLNERSKRRDEEYRRKEERYTELANSLRGFYVDTFDTQLRSEFLRQLNLCWLYCPDDVIQRAYEFLRTVHTGADSSDVDKGKAVGELMLAVRKDLINRKPVKATNLKAEDFQHLRAT